MCLIVSLVCLFAVYEISYGNTDLTPEQVFLNINRQYEKFPETVIKPILQELENMPKLTSELKSKQLSMKAAHETNSEIDIQPAGTSSGPIKVKHAANSEFHVTPHRSDTATVPVRNTIKLGGRKVVLVSNQDIETLEETRQNKIYFSNLDSGLNSIPSNLNTVNIYPLTPLNFLPDSQPKRDVTVLQPRTFLVANTVRQPPTRLVSSLPSLNLVTRSEQVLLPRFSRFFPRTSMGINSIAIQPANRIEIIHREPLSAIQPVSIKPMAQPAPLPLLPVGSMVPVPCNCLTQPMCCGSLFRVF